MSADLQSNLESKSLTGKLVLVIVLTMSVMLLDGYDMQVLALVVPILSESWGIPVGEFGWVQSAAVLGLGLGAGFIAPFGDRWGRRPLTLIGIFILALSVFACAYTATPLQMCIARLIMGTSLGAVLPNVTGLVAEYSPKSKRATLLTFIGIGISFGAIGSGLVVPSIIESYDWQGAFLLSALVSSLVLLCLFIWLPESPEILRRKSKATDDANVSLSAKGVVNAAAEKEPSLFLDVLKPPLRSATILIWLLFTGNAFILYVLVSWVPTALIEHGWEFSKASKAVSTMQTGGLVGGLIIASLMDLWKPAYALLCGYFISAVCLIAFSFTGSDLMLWSALFAVVGAGVMGIHNTLSAVVAMIYPARLLSTGIGLTVAVARIGAVAGPIVGGILISRHWPIELFFGALVVPVALCSTCVLLLMVNDNYPDSKQKQQ